MKSKTFLIVLSSLIGFMIVVYVSSIYSITTHREDTLKEFSKKSYSGSHYGRTQDGVLCTVSYSWYVNHTINEDEHLKIDLLLKRTIAKSFSYYEYEQITKISDDFTVDFKSRLEDAVFAIEPEFVITHVFITTKSTL